ncbi:YolD-like family protein [Alteribacter natronophilus]|uniref:YolD-like family protein n=1 Tax=Alteribacter natronophilus TaxID=2583810 RepID=UPI00110DF52A|nr:YolD-like family protein [Alteribacter natronophilus]TMW73704.1 YolD-like family protein [Alteribacter natronophilus]
MVHDRGTIKWTSMMLPEHVEKLKELEKRNSGPEEKEADPQAIEEWNRLILHSKENGTVICISFLKQNRTVNISGYVTEVNPARETFTVTDGNGYCTAIPFPSVTGVE